MDFRRLDVVEERRGTEALLRRNYNLAQRNLKMENK